MSIAPIEEWFASRGWKPFDFQRNTWEAYGHGKSGLIHAPTGTGKSYSALFGPLAEWIEMQSEEDWGSKAYEPLTVLWITPLRALTNDIAESISKPVKEMGLPWTVETRTGDTSTSQRTRQKTSLPTILVTTPESLSLFLTYGDTQDRFKTLKTIVVDEWHELLSSKRGTLTELALARLRTWIPKLRVWGLSATLGNLEEALEVLMGTSTKGVLISQPFPKEIRLETLLPSSIERFPWSGHLGFKMLPNVVRAIDDSNSTLLFTNTRAQAELWYQALLSLRPEWNGKLSIHHGSIDRALRVEAETGLREGLLKCVVATSSLDLGVDFAPVDQVIQVGSPKGVARLLQRAGRSGHQPGSLSKMLAVPTNAFEIVEFAAARYALEHKIIEPRHPLPKPFDVLVQHIVSSALGGGFKEDELLGEIRTAYSYRTLTEEEWRWAMNFAERGGESLHAYPEYNRIGKHGDKYIVTTRQIARMHRMSVGTIASDQMMSLKFLKVRSSLGSIEESFVARLKPKEKFIFAGKALELIRVRDMTAYVKLAGSAKGSVPRWQGGRMPLSSELATTVKTKLDVAAQGDYSDPEMRAVKPLIDLQTQWSKMPGPNELLVELTKDRQGHHAFIFPFEGRLSHGGLAPLLSYRISKRKPISISHAMTDYGFELLSATDFEIADAEWKSLLSLDNLLEDILQCMNTVELARRQFREIARVAGLIFTGYPGNKKNAKQIQASSGLFYEVFRKYDPANLLLEQADREVLERELEYTRLEHALRRIQEMDVVVVRTERFTPLAFPIWADRIRGQVSSESWADRVKKMALKLEQSADKAPTKKKH